jgi:hypothetical protein
MSRQTCKYFGSPAGCKFGDSCYFAHVGVRQDISKLCIYAEGGYSCPLTKCNQRHILTKEEGINIRHIIATRKQEKFEKQQAEEKRKRDELHNRALLNESIMQAEYDRKKMQCAFGLAWRAEFRIIRQTIRGIFPDSLLMIIAEYNIVEFPDMTTYQRLHYDQESKLCKYNDTINFTCFICFKEHHDIWVSINERIVTDDDTGYFEFNKICRNCLQLDFVNNRQSAHVVSSDGSEPIWVSNTFRPIVDWDDKIRMEWINDVLTPMNKLTKLRFCSVNNSSWLMPLYKFILMVNISNSEDIWTLLGS